MGIPGRRTWHLAREDAEPLTGNGGSCMVPPARRSLPNRQLAMVSWLLALAVGCPTGTDVGKLDGTYALVRLNDAPLPFDTGPVPPRPGTDSTCRILVTSGTLAFDAARSSYVLEYINLESCTQRVLGVSGSSGTFLQRGDRVELTMNVGAGRTETIIGKVDATSITLADAFYRYRFQR